MSLLDRPTIRGALATSLLQLLLATAAWSQGLPPIEHEFANGSTLRFYGQINKGVLSYDDGIDQETYGLIDNSNSNTRVGLRYDQSFGAWSFENVNEFGYDPFSTSNTSIVHQSPEHEDWQFDNDNIRKIDFTLAHDRYGKFWIGQGSMATDGIYEIDLSGTTMIDYSSVADTAAGQIIRFSDPGLSFDDSLSGITIGDAFTNYDGPRRVRFRYDTPAFNGFVAAAAFGRNLLSDDPDVRDENIVDASLSYGSTFDTVEFEAGVGYYWEEDDTRNWGGSASALHTPTGLNGTIAIGGQDADGGTGSYWYGKLGLLRDFVGWGATAAAIDYYSGDDIFLDEDAGITSSTSDSVGVTLVQNIDRANTELWLTWRSYDYSDNAESYEDGRAVFGGARFRF
jgi:hypothetical protein